MTTCLESYQMEIHVRLPEDEGEKEAEEELPRQLDMFFLPEEGEFTDNEWDHSPLFRAKLQNIILSFSLFLQYIVAFSLLLHRSFVWSNAGRTQRWLLSATTSNAIWLTSVVLKLWLLWLLFGFLGKSKKPGAQIGSYEFNGGDNQLWDFEFVGGSTGISQSTVRPRYL